MLHAETTSLTFNLEKGAFRIGKVVAESQGPMRWTFPILCLSMEGLWMMIPQQDPTTKDMKEQRMLRRHLFDGGRRASIRPSLSSGGSKKKRC
jgi:hypothetical protein